MRVIFIGVAALALALLAILPAQATHVPHISRSTSSFTAHRCAAPWDQAVQPSGGGANGWAEADWEGQTCNFAMQVRAKCSNRFTAIDEYSGIVTGNEIEDRASCTPEFSTLDKASINFRESGFWTGWCEIWPVYNNCTT